LRQGHCRRCRAGIPFTRVSLRRRYPGMSPPIDLSTLT
jgi:hypothetical protein